MLILENTGHITKKSTLITLQYCFRTENLGKSIIKTCNMQITQELKLPKHVDFCLSPYDYLRIHIIDMNPHILKGVQTLTPFIGKTSSWFCLNLFFQSWCSWKQKYKWHNLANSHSHFWTGILLWSPTASAHMWCLLSTFILISTSKNSACLQVHQTLPRGYRCQAMKGDCLDASEWSA